MSRNLPPHLQHTAWKSAIATRAFTPHGQLHLRIRDPLGVTGGTGRRGVRSLPPGLLASARRDESNQVAGRSGPIERYVQPSLATERGRRQRVRDRAGNREAGFRSRCSFVTCLAIARPHVGEEVCLVARHLGK